MNTMTLRVRCTIEVDVKVPNDRDPEFDIEENHCPGTGVVGSAIEREMTYHEVEGTCWGCAAQGKNEIIAVNGIPVGRR